jgi:hypothetical protein
MACCVIGSMLMVAVMAVTRWVKAKILKQPEARPEAWRLS